jgi:phage repressor protein C with HTH and peptisase S24 domain
MAPAYKSGDWLMVYWKGKYRVGQVLVVEREDHPGVLLVKRLLRIVDGKYWVEGDNKNVSTDSRHWGAISAGEVRGKVLFRYRRAIRSR